MKSSELLSSARKDASLSIRELAKLADVSPSTIHRIEKQEVNPTVEMLENILGSMGTDLIISSEVEYSKNVFGLVRSVREDVANNDTEWVVRKTAEFVTRSLKRPQIEQLRYLVMAPPTTGSIRWDAFVAGIVEWIMHQSGITVTGSWVEEPQYYLGYGWFVSNFKSLHAMDIAGTPMSLKIRGVYIHGESLINI